MATTNMHMNLEIEFPKETWLTLRKPCHLQTDGQTDGRTDKVNPVYPPPTSLGGGIKIQTANNEEVFLTHRWRLGPCFHIYKDHLSRYRDYRYKDMFFRRLFSYTFSFLPKTPQIACLISLAWSLLYKSYFTHCGLVTPYGNTEQRSESTLSQVMACCLTTPSHYLNQCWLIVSEIQWHLY